MQAQEIIKLISESKKTTPSIAFVAGDLRDLDRGDLHFVGGLDFGVLIGDYKEIKRARDKNKDRIRDFHVEVRARNSAIPLADLTKYDARIEPGAIIRDMVEIGRGVVIMMGAVINIGAVIGPGTMIDMNAVIGGRAIIGSNCHIGAGTVIAGVIEPPSATPVVIEDNVLIGANAVILEGVKVGKGAIVGAGSIVTKDVPEKTVVVGAPARIVKRVDENVADKSKIVEDLRNL
ncbi:MAG TPA: 2,3,4,5-tetrahydropyridine-2,6-dicarboxylate N-acetyltransferase [Acetomicrobium sp.]|nr:2,3,4,5-tetrahydropyridine-2,6-dicarboxylate N-acetyltransferase [Acetomicrobium sp.]